MGHQTHIYNATNQNARPMATKRKQEPLSLGPTRYWQRHTHFALWPKCPRGGAQRERDLTAEGGAFFVTTKTKKARILHEKVPCSYGGVSKTCKIANWWALKLSSEEPKRAGELPSCVGESADGGANSGFTSDSERGEKKTWEAHSTIKLEPHVTWKILNHAGAFSSN